ncbi:ribonuclease E/G [Albimonas sp. CAU 1670]|uniref:ribonuclease E/G n=1 Tax=Albimonas sp. CAU 1670 TaxID=3032599 RepID=UPI0023D98D2C|nr:ribonuclease E/G [Albimonas sp. CAU 1670]MDF2233139.1 ribonuclease E/G [Albimonas sp. CAU 1670]
MKGRAVLILEDEPGWPMLAARMENGRLEDLLVDPPESDPTPRIEAVHLARVIRRVEALGAVFLDLGDGREGFLKAPRKARPGERLLVQIARHAEPGKATPVSDEPLYKGRYAILTPHAPGINVARRIRDDDEAARLRAVAEDALAEAGLGPDDLGEAAPGAILRSAAEGVDPDAVAEDVAALAGLLNEARAAEAGDAAPGEIVAAPDAVTRAWRDWVDPEPDEVIRGDLRLWDDLGALDQLGALLRPRVGLTGEAWMMVEPTSALVAVDVNTGGDFSTASGLKANLAALADLPRQLRLRGLGGQIVVDLAPLSKRDRKQAETAIKRALREDPVETQVLGWTPLGHLELSRRRERRALSELLPRDFA